MSESGKRVQKGVWKRVASCLQRYVPKGTYYAVVRRRGKLIRHCLDTDRLEVAKRKLRDYLNESEDSPKEAFEVELGAHLKDFRAGLVGKEKTLKRYDFLEQKIRGSWPGGTRQKVRNIDLNQCRQWLGQFAATPHQYNHARQFLLAFFRFAQANKVMSRLPFDSETLKPLKRPKVTRVAPTPDEFEDILTAVRSQIYTDHASDSADLLEMMGRAGLGRAELSRMKWKDVSFADGTVSVFRVKTSTAFTIPLYPKVRPLLERMKQQAGDVTPDTPIFKVSDPKKALAAACKKLKLPAYAQRSLRCMFIIEAIKKTVPIKTIAEWQGHQDGGVLILKTYSDVIHRDANREMAELLA